MITQISYTKYHPAPKNKRISLPRNSVAWKNLVTELWEENNQACQSCGKYLNRNEVNPHHIIRVGSGGPDTKNNLSCLCTFCHNEAHR